MTNDKTNDMNAENPKFEPETAENQQTVEKMPEQDIDAELLGEDGGEAGFPDMDENMFAQVQEMMSKMERADELEKENADLRGRLGRLAADFESYRRRTQEDAAGAEDRGKARAAEALMPVYDDLDRAVTMGSGDPAKLIPGMQSVQATVLRVFAQLGLEATGKAGEHFDPQWHEALQVIPGDEEDGTIAQVYQLGFKMGDKLVRPARVAVNKNS